MVAPTIFVGMRMLTTTYVYDDRDPALPPQRPPGTAARVVSTIASPAYTPEDRALLMALDAYESGLCNCGVPREVAWHSEMDGYFEGQRFVCFACTARAGEDAPSVVYGMPVNTRPTDKPVPPFVLGVTTTDS